MNGIVYISSNAYGRSTEYWSIETVKNIVRVPFHMRPIYQVSPDLKESTVKY